MSDYTIKLPIFEGPLDLLLHLIKINEMEITEISISQITGQYLETLRLMETLDLEVAGDFLVMAATLLNIKLRSILPEVEEEIEEGEQEEAGDDYLTARALMQRLIEYRRFKEAAHALGGMAERQAMIFVREVALPALKEAQADPGVRGDLGMLLEAFARVIKFVQRREYHEVAGEEYNVDDKIDMVRRRLLLEDRIDVAEVFRGCQAKVEMIVTLLAFLELCRLKELRINQIDCYGSILAFARRGEEPAGEEAAEEAAELQRAEAEILANRTGLVDNSAPPEDEEDALLAQVLDVAPEAAPVAGVYTGNGDIAETGAIEMEDGEAGGEIVEPDAEPETEPAPVAEELPVIEPDAEPILAAVGEEFPDEDEGGDLEPDEEEPLGNGTDGPAGVGEDEAEEDEPADGARVIELAPEPGAEPPDGDPVPPGPQPVAPDPEPDPLAPEDIS